MVAQSKVQVPATVESTHQMVVALVIFFAVGMLLVIFAGESKVTGNTIAGFLALILVVQGITHVNPFVSFLANHPLTPTAPKPVKKIVTPGGDAFPKGYTGPPSGPQ